MNCNPKPTVRCGYTLNDTCIVFTGTMPSCFNLDEDCYRQSEFNEATGNLLCLLKGKVDCFYESIGSPTNDSCLIEGLTYCSTALEDKNIKDNFQFAFDKICDITVNLALPVCGMRIPTCIQNPCDTECITLGEVLQGLLDNTTCSSCPVWTPLVSEIIEDIGFNSTDPGTYQRAEITSQQIGTNCTLVEMRGILYDGVVIGQTTHLFTLPLSQRPSVIQWFAVNIEATSINEPTFPTTMFTGIVRIYPNGEVELHIHLQGNFLTWQEVHDNYRLSFFLNGVRYYTI